MNDMTRFLALFIGMVFPFTLPVSADPAADRPVLVELFASQNCQACPKAHRTLRSVAAEDTNIVVLTWSVDYWDYLGNPDPMAMPESKVRQDAYVENLSLRAPYTPQSVYNGETQCPATRKKTVTRTINAQRGKTREDDPVLVQNGTQVRVDGDCSEPLDVMMVRYLSDDQHETDMLNPVIASEPLGTCDADSSTFAANCDGQCAILLQEPGFGRVLSTLLLN